MMRAILSCLLLLIAAPAFGQDGTALLAKAIVAFQGNVENEKHWNWSIVESRYLEARAGQVVERFPSVTSESVLRSNGMRCNAVTAWSDGLAPYMKDADAEQRCQAYSALSTPFQVVQFLLSTRSKVVENTASSIRVEVFPDSSKAKSEDPFVRCAASLHGLVDLDPSTFFPMRIEGDVAGTGCDGKFRPVVYYGPGSNAPVSSQFRKSATFLLVYTLQADRFGNPANSYWISTEQRYVHPWSDDSRVLIYWGRQVAVRSTNARRYVKEVRVTAREFGAGSSLLFDSEPGKD